MSSDKIKNKKKKTRFESIRASKTSLQLSYEIKIIPYNTNRIISKNLILG